MTYAVQRLVRRNAAPATSYLGATSVSPAGKMNRPPDDYARRQEVVAGPAFGRVRGLAATFDAHHPLDPYHYLVIPVVHPDRQNRGIGSALPDRHLARLDRAGFPANLEANDPPLCEVPRRHGSVCRSVIQSPGGSPPWTTMWRSPMP
jgi:GNAT superfamily N-acetyltransferase